MMGILSAHFSFDLKRFIPNKLRAAYNLVHIYSILSTVVVRCLSELRINYHVSMLMFIAENL
jgi:hypothetical protein